LAFTVEQLHAALRDLDGVRYGAGDLHHAVQRIVGVTHDLFGVDGAALMLIDDQLQLRHAAVSDDRLRELEDLQLRYGTGPGIDAFETKTLVGCDDLDRDDRWPAFAEEATELGMRALLASPIPFASDAVGVVVVFSSTPHAWTPEGELALTAFTDLAALAILLGLQSDQRGDRALQLQRALDARTIIEQAKGVLVGQRQVSPAEALASLRDEARRTRRKLSEVAGETVAAAQHGQPTPLSVTVPDGGGLPSRQ
jgi:GAF domain-containing protein